MCDGTPSTGKIDLCLRGHSTLNFGLDSEVRGLGVSQIPLGPGFLLSVETLLLSQNLPEKIEFEETYSTVA